MSFKIFVPWTLRNKILGLIESNVGGSKIMGVMIQHENHKVIEKEK